MQCFQLGLVQDFVMWGWVNFMKLYTVEQSHELHAGAVSVMGSIDNIGDQSSVYLPNGKEVKCHPEINSLYHKVKGKNITLAHCIYS